MKPIGEIDAPEKILSTEDRPQCPGKTAPGAVAHALDEGIKSGLFELAAVSESDNEDVSLLPAYVPEGRLVADYTPGRRNIHSTPYVRC